MLYRKCYFFSLYFFTIEDKHRYKFKYIQSECIRNTSQTHHVLFVFNLLIITTTRSPVFTPQYRHECVLHIDVFSVFWGNWSLDCVSLMTIKQHIQWFFDLFSRVNPSKANIIIKACIYLWPCLLYTQKCNGDVYILIVELKLTALVQ